MNLIIDIIVEITQSRPMASKKDTKKDNTKDSKPLKGNAKAAEKQIKTDGAHMANGVIPPASGLSNPVDGLVATVEPAVDADEVVLTDAEGRRYCRATDCDQIGLVDGYCRYHYLYYWKKIQVRKKILADGKLERYIEELTARYTDKFIELLRKDLRTEKDFLAAIQELELDDSASASQQDEDEAKTYLEEISGVASESARDDEGY